MPGTIWMVVFFAIPFYGVMAIAGGRDDLLFNTRDPVWNPFALALRRVLDRLGRDQATASSASRSSARSST